MAATKKMLDKKPKAVKTKSNTTLFRETRCAVARVSACVVVSVVVIKKKASALATLAAMAVARRRRSVHQASPNSKKATTVTVAGMTTLTTTSSSAVAGSSQRVPVYPRGQKQTTSVAPSCSGLHTPPLRHDDVFCRHPVAVSHSVPV